MEISFNKTMLGAQVRAFSVNGQRGNVALVFATGPDVAGSVQMCISLAESAQSEVTWIQKGSTPSGIGLRFFSPSGEITFCGHGTLAAAAWLASRSIVPKEMVFDIGGNPFRVGQDERDLWWYLQDEAATNIIDSDEVLLEVGLALGLSKGQLRRMHDVRLARSVGAPREKILLELPTESDLSSLRINAARRDALCERLQATGLYVFSIRRHADEPRILARHFPIYCADQEDMATGGIAPTIARYANVSDMSRVVLIEQGGQYCRNSRIFVSPTPCGTKRRVAGECVVGPDEEIMRSVLSG